MTKEGGVGKRYVDAGAKCPYYCSEGTGKIYCEGFLREQWVHLAWMSDTERKAFKKKFCKGQWESCPIAKLEREK